MIFGFCSIWHGVTKSEIKSFSPSARWRIRPPCRLQVAHGTGSAHDPVRALLASRDQAVLQQIEGPALGLAYEGRYGLNAAEHVCGERNLTVLVNRFHTVLFASDYGNLLQIGRMLYDTIAPFIQLMYYNQIVCWRFSINWAYLLMADLFEFGWGEISTAMHRNTYRRMKSAASRTPQSI